MRLVRVDWNGPFIKDKNRKVGAVVKIGSERLNGTPFLIKCGHFYFSRAETHIESPTIHPFFRVEGENDFD